MSQKAYLYILKFGLLLSLITPLLISGNFLFPYISTKQVYFNILIEILAIFWIVFIFKYPEWRPKKSLISIGLIAYFSAIFISTLTGVDFNLSFWGDVERMLGFFHILHFLIFYFILITVIRGKRDWLNLFNVSVVIATLVSLYSFKINHSTIGNTAYVSGYLLFNIYFVLILISNYKNWAYRAAYILALIPMLLTFIKMQTSGAYVGLGVSLLLLLFLSGILNRNKKVRMATFSSFAVVIILISLVFGFKNSAFVKNNYYLNTLTSLISSDKITFKTRLISWNAALKDFPEHPIFGTGHGNYAIIFDRHFDPKFYDYMRSDTYFDRAHNNLIDIVSTIGLVGLITYLSIFAAVAYYLISGFRNGKINSNEFALLVALVSAYFIQNLAIFDSLVTYISLMVTLGYIYWLNRPEPVEAKDEPLDNKEIFLLGLVGMLALIVIYQYDYKPIKMLTGTIDGQRVYARTGDMPKVMEEYKKALSYGTGLDRDSRTTFIRLITQNPSVLKNLPVQKAREILEYAISLGEKNLAHNPEDSLQLMEMAQLLNITATFYNNEADNFNAYLHRAEEMMDRAIAASPGRIPPYFAKAQIHLTRGDYEKTVETLKYAISLNPKYPDSHCQLGKFYFYFQKQEEGYRELDQCIDLGGVGALYPAALIKELGAHYAVDPKRALPVYRRLTELDPKDTKAWIELAKLYAAAGKKEEARNAALKAAEVDPSLREGVENFIRNLE